MTKENSAKTSPQSPLAYPTERDTERSTKPFGNTDDAILIDRVLNGWVVMLQPTHYGVKTERLVFNNFDDMCETLRKLYEDRISNES